MKAIKVLLIAAALVLLCQSFNIRQQKNYTTAGQEFGKMTYEEIAPVYFTQQGRVTLGNFNKDNKKGLYSYGDKCGLTKAGKDYVNAMMSERANRFVSTTTLNASAFAKVDKQTNESTKAKIAAKKKYDAAIACDDKNFAAFEKKMKSSKRGYWAQYLKRERDRYLDYSNRLKNTWDPIYRGDICGTKYTLESLNDKILNWNNEAFKKEQADPTGKGKAPPSEVKAYNMLVAEKKKFDKEVACNAKHPVAQKHKKEIENELKVDTDYYLKYYAKAAAAKKRANDACKIQTHLDYNMWFSNRYRLFQNLGAMGLEPSFKKRMNAKLNSLKPQLTKSTNEQKLAVKCEDMEAKKAKGDSKLKMLVDNAKKILKELKAGLKEDAIFFANSSWWGQDLAKFCRCNHPKRPAYMAKMNMNQTCDEWKKGFDMEVNMMLKAFMVGIQG